ncbi:spore germination protein [Lutispora saccharofermentans]|uniref:Spore germination protein n=1 Tax=Lutispora saccharofermentans TaxID=3024236 RepID=A0ABT1NCT4_9FIRM|nr:spore germination protein [Lutispora saccharofermentans]MCQ1529080.1 spore germination protein [Lutispora saccharofermentans]
MFLFGKKKKAQENEREKIQSTDSLEVNITKVKELLKDCDDVVYKEFVVGVEQKLRFTAIYIDGMIDTHKLNNAVLNPLMIQARYIPPEAPKLSNKLYELVRYGTIPASELKESEDINEAILDILIGDAVLFIDGIRTLITISVKGWPARSIDEPSTEAVIRGPRDGFVETFRMNTALVRRRIRDHKLKLKQLRIGRRSQTDVGVFYIEDIAKAELVDEVFRRLKSIEIDAILDSGYIEQLIEDDPYSPFPQILASERPDEAAAELYEGRVVILVDNSPFCLIMPATLNSMFQSPEDYYDRWIIATVLRTIRYAASLIAMVLPSLYIALTSYNTGILPTKLILSIAASREGVPFPALVEAFVMEGTLELLREAGIRLPVSIGNAIGIVGGLVIGEAAVRAGIVSPIMVIIVAITAIASFANPSYNLSVGFRLLRFSLMVISGILGLYGLALGLIMIFTHMARLKCFNVPYLTPYVAVEPGDFKDTIYRAPTYKMIKRPPLTSKNVVRMRNNRPVIDDKAKGGTKDDKRQ